MRPLLFSLLLASAPPLAQATQPLEQAAFAPRYEHVGMALERRNQTLLNYLWVDVYAAAFYTAPGVSPRQAIERPAAQRLELYYFRAIDREDVIKAAWTTLERQYSPAHLAPLRAEIDRLHQQFQDIAPGDRYALDFDPRSGLRLERNGQTLFSSPDTALAKTYLGIWLAADGLSEVLRQALLAGS
ncbi:MAG: chalcone isomerase family protein [Pseudomonas sp.]|uniref:chalcone isomerase family protein n=1 Tax=Pseudomonas sp. TaxID=306 RepID=UPI00339A5D06